MKKLFYLLSLVLVGAIVIFSAGCSDDDDDAAGITQDQIVGTWIGFYDTVFEGPNGADCDAIFFDLDVAGNIKILSFLGGEPAAGHKGTYSIEGDQIMVSLTHDWAEKQNDEHYLNWVEALYEVAIYAAISSDGNVLTGGPSEEEAWQLNKIELSDIDDGFIGDWFDDGTDGLWKINTSGSYDYSEPDYSESGQLEQFTYDGNIYFLANTTYTSDVDGPCDAYFVCRVALNGAEDEMTIWYGDYEIVYTPAIQQQQIAGTWIGFYDTVFEGPNGADCDAIFFDLDNAGNIKILSFLGGEPAAGHKGTYSIKGDELVLNLTHDWAEELEGAD